MSRHDLTPETRTGEDGGEEQLEDTLRALEERLRFQQARAREHAELMAETQAEVDRTIKALTRILDDLRRDRIVRMVLSPTTAVTVLVMLAVLYTILA